MTNLDSLFQSALRSTSQAARLVGNLGRHLDALSLDLARDVGAVTRDAQAFATAVTRDTEVLATEISRDANTFATAARDHAAAARVRAVALRDRAATVVRATPRATKLAGAAAKIFARQRWFRLAAAAAGHPGLRPEDHRDLARHTTRLAAELRGGITKLGQLASCRPDLVGSIWASELAALQDDVPSIDAALIRERIEAELGRPVTTALALPPPPGGLHDDSCARADANDDALGADTPSLAAQTDESVLGLFGSFDDVPLAAASLAQVHAATLHDGTRVVVKVQVPGIDDVIAADVAALRTVASMFGNVPGLDVATLADELSRALLAELDYVAEANALREFTPGDAASGVLVPHPILALSTARILTMTRIDGTRLTTWLAAAAPEERDRLLGELVAEIAAQILVRGRVHADPHPGNFLVTPDGALAMLDFGCTLTLSTAERGAYARLVMAIAGGNQPAAASELAVLGFVADAPDVLLAVTSSLISAMRPDATVSELDWEAAFAAQIAHAKHLTGLVIPRSFVLLGRVLATVAGLLATYKPRIHVHALILRHLATAIAAA